MVATLQRSFVDAVSNYKAAVERDPDSEVFAAALEKAEAMIGSNVQYVNDDGGKPPSLSRTRTTAGLREFAYNQPPETVQSALTPEATLCRVCRPDVASGCDGKAGEALHARRDTGGYPRDVADRTAVRTSVLSILDSLVGLEL